MKVLLMVERDGRVVCAWTGASAERAAKCYTRDDVRNYMSGLSGGPSDFVPRWWLVEAESADAARAAIARFNDGHRDGTHGHILASGGKS